MIELKSKIGPGQVLIHLRLPPLATESTSQPGRHVFLYSKKARNLLFFLPPLGVLNILAAFEVASSL